MPSKISSGIKRLLSILGPGLITGASDDDPSGIATYSQAGAKFGLSTLWTSILSFPLMAGIQEMCARIGLVTSVGLTTTLKKHYPKWILYTMMVFSIPAIVLNIGADIAGMGAVANLIIPSIPAAIFNLIFTVILLIVIVFFSYDKIVAFLKFFCLSLLLYIAVPFFTHPNWGRVLHYTLVPTIRFNKDFIEVLVAILGTTISPYLFFWQTTMEAEDVRHARQLVLARRRLEKKTMGNSTPSKRSKGFMQILIEKMQVDVNLGMLFSNFVMYFIILATGTALFENNIRQIDTVEQAAKALAPVAGKASYLLFAIGVIGTGFLAIPVLTGSLSYIVAETFGWEASLNKKFRQAEKFYIVVAVSLLLGLGINYLGVSPIQSLYYTAILYGITSPVLIAIVLHIGNNKKIMKGNTNGRLSNAMGVLTFIIMTAAAVALVWFMI
jgi:Mn2+ and Fe2+ transporters of the NRAMP family